jgi:hypothetical protein
MSADSLRTALVEVRTWARPSGPEAVSEGQCCGRRAEAYNVFNGPHLSNPVTTMLSVDLGRILNMAGDRTMQIGLRLVF